MERNFYAKRLFPCWVMASQEPFKDDVGGAALLDAMNAAVARAHFKEVCWLRTGSNNYTATATYCIHFHTAYFRPTQWSSQLE